MAGWWMFFGGAAGQLNIKVYWDQVYKNVIAQYKKVIFLKPLFEEDYNNKARGFFYRNCSNSLLKLSNIFLFIFSFLQLFYPNKSSAGLDTFRYFCRYFLEINFLR